MKKYDGLAKTSHPIYVNYHCMMDRCHRQGTHNYHLYGGRGITVCTEWEDKENGFGNFLAWAKDNGWKEGLTLDRIDSDGNYEPNNCRWISKSEQSKNRKGTLYYEINGKLVSVYDIAKENGYRKQIFKQNVLLYGLDKAVEIEDEYRNEKVERNQLLLRKKVIDRVVRQELQRMKQEKIQLQKNKELEEKNAKRIELEQYRKDNPTIKDLALKYNVKPCQLYYRMKKLGMSLEDSLEAINKPKEKKQTYSYNCKYHKSLGVSKVAMENGLSISTLSRWVYKKGYSIEDAVTILRNKKKM